jgi:hypothetical protein
MTSAPAVPPTGSGLQRLLELESQLEQRVAAARQEADRIRTEGVRAAAAARERCDAETLAELARLESRVEAERVRTRASLRSDLSRQVAGYRNLAPARVEAIARRLLERLLQPSTGTSTS